MVTLTAETEGILFSFATKKRRKNEVYTLQLVRVSQLTHYKLLVLHLPTTVMINRKYSATSIDYV
jgi:hypothetical protein